MFKYFQKIVVRQYQDSSRRQNALKTLGDTIFLGGRGSQTKKSTNKCLVGPDLRNFRSSSKLRYEEIVFFKDGSIFFLFFLKHFGNS